MKKRILSILTIFGSVLISNAQITIVSNDVFSSSRVVTQGVDFDTQMSGGSAGENQVWDFSNVENEGSATTIFGQADWSPYGAEFPNATFAIEEDTNNFVYVQKNQNFFGVTGVAQDVDGDTDIDIVHFEKPLVQAHFPMNYGGSNSDEGVIFVSIEGDLVTDGYDSVHYRQRVTREVFTDAYGTMILPMGTFEVIRNNIHATTVDSTWIFTAGSKQLVDNTSAEQYGYEWYTDDNRAKYQLAEMEYDITTGNAIDVLFLEKTPEIGVGEFVKLESSVYPNPGANFININCSSDVQNGTLLIMDVQGKVVARELFNGAKVKVDVSDYNNGLFFYQISSQESNGIAKGKFVVFH